MSPSSSGTSPINLSRRGFLGAMSVAAAATAFSGCRSAGPSSTENGAKTLTFNMSSFGSEEIQPYLDTFKEQYGTAAKVSVIPQDYHPTTETRLRAGTDYAVLQADEGYPQKWLANDWIVPLDDVADLPRMEGDMFEALLQAAKVDGKTIALPGSGLTKVMVYNEEVLGKANLEPAETWDEFLEQAIQMKEEGHARYPYVPMWTKAFGLAAYFAIGDSYSRGAAEWFDPESLQPTYHEDPAVLETVEFWRKLWEAEVVPTDVLTVDHNATTEIFAAGQAAYFQHNFGQVLPVLNLDKSKYGAVAGKIKLMMYPGTTHECLTGTNWVCLTKSGAENGGADLARFLGGLDKNGEYLVPTEYRAVDLGVEPGYAPVMDEESVVDQWSEFADVELFAQQKAKSRFIGAVTGAPWFTEWMDRTTAELQSAVIGDKSAEEALQASAEFARSKL